MNAASHIRRPGLATLAAALLLLGCDCTASGKNGGASTASPSPEPVASGTENAGETTVEPKASGSDVRREETSEQPEFEWLEDPRIGDVPDMALAGSVGGKQFRPKTVLLQPARDGDGTAGWKLMASPEELDGETELLDARHGLLEIPGLPQELSKGTWRRALGEGGARLWVKDGDTPAGLRAFGGKSGWVLRIDRLEISPFDPDGPLSQRAGRASGRFAVVFEAPAEPGSDDTKTGAGDAEPDRAWIAGRFDEGLLRYMGPPPW